jgi:hypothetical protein
MSPVISVRGMWVWEEILGFASSSEYNSFKRYIEEQVSRGIARERPVDLRYGKGMICGGRWFQDVETGAVWRLVAPDPPFQGLWEPIVPGFR